MEEFLTYFETLCRVSSPVTAHSSSSTPSSLMVLSLVLDGKIFLPFDDLACIFSFRDSRIFIKSSELCFLLVLLEVCDEYLLGKLRLVWFT